MKVSVVLAVRNEYPTILGTLYSFHEDLVSWCDSFELVVVDNCGTDSTAAILSDKFRRWVKHGILRVVRFDERPANVLARNVGAEAATGSVVIFADGHVSIAANLTRLLYEGALSGGVWHPAFQMWGDTEEIRCYGYELRLAEKFWGSISRKIPKTVAVDENGIPAASYLVPMASHCCLAVKREEFLALGGYGRQLRVYGGGEPLLDLKYWTCGSTVNMEPRALVRHAFGVSCAWRQADRDRKTDTHVRIRRGGNPEALEFSNELRAGDSYLKYFRDYAWTNEDLHHNFMAAAYIVGGYGWLQRMYDVYRTQRAGSVRYLTDLNDLRRQVLSGCAGERAAVKSMQVRSIDDLLASPPWPT